MLGLVQIYKDCFYTAFEEEIHQTIVDNKLFKRGDCVAVAASGGKGESDVTFEFTSSS